MLRATRRSEKTGDATSAEIGPRQDGSDQNEAATRAAEREDLVALYNSTDGGNWTNNTGWLAIVRDKTQRTIPQPKSSRRAAVARRGELVAPSLSHPGSPALVLPGHSRT